MRLLNRGRFNLAEDAVADDKGLCRRECPVAQEYRLGRQLVAAGLDHAGMTRSRRLSCRGVEQILVGFERIGFIAGPAASSSAPPFNRNLFLFDEGEIEQQAEALADDRIGSEFVQIKQAGPGVFLICIRADLNP